VRYGITYGTSHYGSTPIGDQPRTATVAGCFYDSLNVALHDLVPSVGSGQGTMKLRADGSVENESFDTAYTPAVQIKAV